MKPLMWIVALVAIVISVYVALNVFIVTPEAPSQTPPVAIVEPSQEDANQKEICDTIQAKIDAEGRPGWDGLTESLKAEIENDGRKSGCTFQGDGQKF